MNTLFKIFDSKWTVILISTMLGVFLGLYFTNLFEKKRLLKGKEKALSQVSIEIQKNEEALNNFHTHLSSSYNLFQYFISNLNEDMEIIIHGDSLSSFKSKTKDFIQIENLENVSKSTVKINGQLNINFDSKLLLTDLSEIIWNSYKQTDYLSITNFQCLTDIEFIYELQKDINYLNQNWSDEFVKGRFIIDVETRNNFMTDWKSLLEKQKLLLKFYASREEMLKNCS